MKATRAFAMAIVVGTSFLIASCASVGVTAPPIGRPEAVLVPRDGTNRTVQALMGSVPRSARFAFLDRSDQPVLRGPGRLGLLGI